MADKKAPTVDEILEAAKLGSASDNVDKLFATPTLGTDSSGPYKASSGNGVGTISTANGDNYFGINHRQQPSPISINRDQFGLTFFTRPQLNFQTDNLRNHRKLAPLLTTKADSIPRIIRCLLDPRLGSKYQIFSPFVDPQQAFIPLLTNNLLSMSGWPDIEVPIYQSPDGVYKETFGIVDGIVDNYSSYDITASFRNLPGDPITAMLLYWARYMSAVFEGILVPYPDFIIENEIDYQTRIYRLVLDYSRTKVQKIAACGAAIPWGVPIGAAFNFEADRPLNQSNDQVSTSFRCYGAQYQDDVLIKEFNDVVGLHNNDMWDQYRGNGKDGAMRKVPMAYLEVFNNKGYPRIDPRTYDLEWWISKEEYDLMAPKLDAQ